MAESLDRIVIIGSGHAGVELAAALRQHDFGGSIIMVGDEANLPYQRPPLSKEFLKSLDDQGLPLKGETFYASKDIELRLGVSATRIDRSARQVVLSNGDRLTYDHLALATGARNRMPPIAGLDRSRVLELRTIADARALNARLDGLRHAIIIGGGFIGLEVAGMLRVRDIAVDVIEAMPMLMGRVLSSTTSLYFRSFHEGLGTRLHFETLVQGISHRASGSEVQLSSGTAIATGAIMVAAGVVPNVELASEAGLEVVNGVVVNEYLMTADPFISALGDCAAFPSAWSDAMTRLESVQNAVDQARCIAARLTGDARPYDGFPWFWSNQGTARLQIAGLGHGHDSSVLRGDAASGKFSVFLYRNERLIAVESVNSASDHMVARRLLAQGHSVAAGVAQDTRVDLKSLLKAG